MGCHNHLLGSESLFPLRSHGRYKGAIIGRIGGKNENDTWFPQLHVQAVAIGIDASNVDGYGPLYRGVEMDFPRGFDPKVGSGLTLST